MSNIKDRTQVGQPVPSAPALSSYYPELPAKLAKAFPDFADYHEESKQIFRKMRDAITRSQEELALPVSQALGVSEATKSYIKEVISSGTAGGDWYAAIQTEQTARISADEAFASQLVTVQADLGDAHSRITTETTARSTADTAMAQQITTLTAEVNDATTGVTTVESRLTTIEQVIADGENMTALAVRITDLEASVNDPTTGLPATTARVTTVEQSYATKTFAEAKKTEAISAAADDATAKVNTESVARVSADSAIATRTTTLEASVGAATDPANPAGSLHARLKDTAAVSATATEAVAARATTLEASVNHPVTGLAQAHSRISTEETARTNADTAIASRATSLETTVGAHASKITTIETTYATKTEAEAKKQEAISAAASDATAKVTEESTARANADGALASRATVLESTVNNPTTGVAAMSARVNTIETTYATQNYADAKKAEAISASAGDATIKANTAKSDAITAAATDATGKANTAKLDAITAAALDASNKRDEAKAFATASVNNEAAARATDVSALAMAVSTVVAAIGDSHAQLDHFEIAQADANSAFTLEISNAKSRLDTAESSIETIQSTFATKDYAETTVTNSISAAVGDMEQDATDKAAEALRQAKLYAEEQAASAVDTAEDNAKLYTDSEITTVVNTQSTKNTTFSGKIETLESTVGNADTGLAKTYSKISALETTYTTESTALANRTKTLESTVNDEVTGLAAARAKLQTIEDNYVTKDAASASKTDIITAATRIAEDEAGAAYDDAVRVAGIDASDKATKAYNDAVKDAAIDATQKASDAYDAAELYTDGKATAVEKAAKSYSDGVITNEQTTRATETKALARAISTLLATIGDNAACVQILSDAFVTATGRAVSTWGFKLDANGKVVGMQATAQSGGGQPELGEIVFTGANLRSDNFVDGSSGWKIGYDGNVRINQLIVKKGLITTGITLQTNPANCCYNPNFDGGNFGWTEDNAGAWTIAAATGELGWGCTHNVSAQQAIRNNMYVSVVPGDVLMARARVYGSTAYVRISWYQANSDGTPGAEINAHPDSAYGVAGAWSTVRIAGTCPEGSAFARLELVSSTAGEKFDGCGMFFVPSVGELAAPGLSHSSQSFTGSISVTMSHPQSGVTIRYTLDGTEPTQRSSLYSTALTITTSTTLRAKAFAGGGAMASPEVTANYSNATASIRVPAPTYVITSGTLGRFPITVTATCEDASATIYYSTDDINWSVGSTRTIPLDEYCSFKAVRSGYTDSYSRTVTNNAWTGEDTGL